MHRGSATANRTFDAHRYETRRQVRASEWIAAVALAVIVALHVADLSAKFAELPYLGVAYIGLITASVVALMLILGGGERGWRLAGAVALVAIAGYVLSRTTGLPRSAGDIGNWSEPLGVASLLAEGTVVVLAADARRRARRARRSLS